MSSLISMGQKAKEASYELGIASAGQKNQALTFMAEELVKAKDEIINRLCKMQDLGADLPKIAVMPNTSEDVVTLLAATEEMHTKYAKQPIITMSMGALGLVSRLSGETFGSALTFGAAKAASAPGQISVDKLALILDVMHQSK